MALFLTKNFMKMSQSEYWDTMVHCGPPQCTNRMFRDVLKRDNRNSCELRFLQEIVDELDHGADDFDFPFGALLRLEYGESLCPMKDLPEDVLNYLSNTPSGMLQLDYQEAIRVIRERFKLVECDHCNGFPAADCQPSGPHRYVRIGV